MLDFVSISYCQFNRQKDFLIGQSFKAAAHKLSMFQITPLSFSSRFDGISYHLFLCFV